LYSIYSAAAWGQEGEREDSIRIQLFLRRRQIKELKREQITEKEERETVLIRKEKRSSSSGKL
jgi:hypothetical protein